MGERIVHRKQNEGMAEKKKLKKNLVDWYYVPASRKSLN